MEKKIRKGWIQGNIISFKKPTFRSAFFDLEEVLVISTKTIENKNFDKINEIIEYINSKDDQLL